jgi:glyceraldehyde 3-phosphate dehydrogenase
MALEPGDDARSADARSDVGSELGGLETASVYEEELNTYVEKERMAVRLATRVGELLFERNVELVLFRKPLVDTTTSEILRMHEYACKVVGRQVDVLTTSMLATELCSMDLGPAKIDIGRLAYEWLADKGSGVTQAAFLAGKLADYSLAKSEHREPRDVVLYGFGRIGRLAARQLILGAGKGQQLRLRAVVTRDKKKEDILKRAALFANDSLHGEFKGIVDSDVAQQQLVINGQIVQFISAEAPEEIDYTAYGIHNALLIDNTGAWTDKETLSRHLKSRGVDKVVLTAPGAGIPNIVYGVNQHEVNMETDKIVCAASCTTNAIVPVLKVVEETFGIARGHCETIHSYTNDQNLVDNFHKSSRRGRAAAINMVISSTGAAKAVPKIIPSLKGKLTANAVRVPTPNASLAILQLQLNREVTVEEVNDRVRLASIQGDLVNQIYYSVDDELVSSDVVGNECAAVFDSQVTIVSEDKKNVVLYIWYDNEFGYTKQVVRLTKYFGDVRRKCYY